MVHNAEWRHTQCSIALGTVVSLGSRQRARTEGTGLREKKYCMGTTTGWREEHGGAAASDTLKACEVNDGLDEDGVISDVGVLGV